MLSPLTGLLWLSPRAAVPSVAFRALCSSSCLATPSQSRGGLPRFHSPSLPSSKGAVVRINGDEAWHITTVLRLRTDDRMELFDGKGGLVECCLSTVGRTGLDIVAIEDPKVIPFHGIHWHVYAAFGTLKGGRADWLVEKCTELGASGVTPIQTDRSPIVAGNRIDRLERVALAASKQCQRLHKMNLNPPIKFKELLSSVSKSELALLAAPEATPLMNILYVTSVKKSGLLIVGPEGDFTDEEVRLTTEAGAIAVGLGPCRLRVETATVVLLSTLMLWSDAQMLGY